MASFKKDTIKDQMVKTAARLWEVPENEIESNFDPLVLLLIEACAAELEKIGYSISSSHTRLLNRLADLLVPEAILGPIPGSCVASTLPVEPVAEINDQHHFYTTLQVIDHFKGTQYNQDIFFTPIGSFKILKATLSYFFTSYKLFGLNKTNSKELLYTNDALKNSSTTDIWLAITPDKDLRSLQGLSLYFELRSIAETENFYNNLGNAKAYIDGKLIAVEKGYYHKGNFEMSPEEMLASGHHYSSKLTRQAAGIYQNRFLHIKEDVKALGTPPPENLQLPEQILQQIKSKSLIYIRIELPGSFPQQLIDRLTCSINAFPVINRKKDATNYKTDEWVNIIPLPSTGNFLDIESITSITGSEYKFRTSSETRQVKEGEALLRSTGVGKTSSQQVREMAAILTEAIRDQSAYFKEINNDFILTRLSEISKILARLEDNMAAAENNVDTQHYVMLRSQKPNDIVSIKYWSTNGLSANQIKAGSFLTPHNHSLMGAKETFLLTNVYGGRDGVEETEKKYLLKQQLISRGKIISAEDVKLLCVQLFGNKLKKVSVQKGVNTGIERNVGFIRTINVTIWLEKDVIENMQSEIEYLRNELEYRLAKDASMVYPFRVILTAS